MVRYRDRSEAGQVLAGLLGGYAGRHDVVVLGLPRGGVPVAAPIAAALDAPLDVFVVRKLGLPGHEELAMGAVGSGAVTVRNGSVLAQARVPEATFERVRRRERAEVVRREAAYRDGREAVPVAGRTVIVVDDGLATGASMRAALAGLSQLRPARLVVALPVASTEGCAALRDDGHEVVCASTPIGFMAVGSAYLDFTPTSDDQVRALLAAAAADPCGDMRL
jgi:predicted phosphoribosyltransferase